MSADGVFEGVPPTRAPARFFHHTFAEPDRTFTQHEDHLYPRMAPSAGRDHRFSGKTGDYSVAMVSTRPDPDQHLDGILAEGASLLTTDPTAIRPALPNTARVYMVAGTRTVAAPAHADARRLRKP